MSQSPLGHARLYGSRGFQDALARLDRMIFDGRSFSGRERNRAFLNLAGEGAFANISAASGLDFADDGRALATSDWDGDGDLDLWIVNRSGPQLRLMRNNSIAENRSLSLRLEGRKSNRDAVGARVEVELEGDQGNLFARALRAGDGFLSQSSKWLHFGLGRSGRVASVAVRWPGGGREGFSGIEPVGGRYHLREGDGKARPAQPRPLVALAAKDAEQPKPPSRSTLWLASRPPLPRFDYETFQGKELAVKVAAGRPTLVNLWAAWCGPCRSELTEWTRRAGDLRAAGLRLLALSVDGLGQDDSGPAQAREFLGDIDFPFSSGMATPSAVRTLETLHRLLIDLRRPLALPSSFLVDRQGHLAAVYQGTVPMERLFSDLQALPFPPRGNQQRAAALPGRWSAPPPRLSLSAVAQGFAEEGLADEARRYLELAEGQQALEDGFHDPAYADARNNLGLLRASQGRFEEAIEHYRAALRAKPDYSKARNNLGVALAASGRLAEAARELSGALNANPEDAELLSNMGAVLLQQGRAEVAIGHFEMALKVNPAMPRTLYLLSMAQARAGRPGQALASARKGLERALALGQTDLVPQLNRQIEQLREK